MLQLTADVKAEVDNYQAECGILPKDCHRNFHDFQYCPSATFINALDGHTN